MRISDWSSDVCSSDLGHLAGLATVGILGLGHGDEPAAVGRERAVDDVHVLAQVGRRRCAARVGAAPLFLLRSDEHTSELQSLMRISYAVFCLKKKKDKSKNQIIP